MNVRMIDDDRDFLGLKESWEALAEDYPPYSGFEWNYRWWRSHKKGYRLRILVAERKGTIEGIAPLFVRREKAFRVFPVDTLSFIGGYISDYLDVLIRPGPDRERTFMSLFAHMMGQGGVDEVSLRQINTDSPNSDLWTRACTRARIDFEPYRTCPRINLKRYADFEDYERCLEPKYRRRIRSVIKKIDKDFPDRAYVFRERVEPSDLETMSRLNFQRQKYLYQKGDTDRFSFFLDPRDGEFIADYFCDSRRNNLLVAYLKVKGTVVSYLIFLEDRNRLLGWNMAFDVDYIKYSPTKALLYESIRYAFGRGFEYYDFQRGQDAYKTQWTNESTQISAIEFHRSPKSKVIRGLQAFKPAFVAGVLKKIRLQRVYGTRDDVE